MYILIILLLLGFSIPVAYFLISYLYNYDKLEKKPKKLEWVTEEFDVGKVEVTIIDINNNSFNKVIIGIVVYKNEQNKTRPIIIDAIDLFENTIYDFYAKTRLFPIDEGSYIPEHRIKHIKSFYEEYFIEFSYNK